MAGQKTIASTYTPPATPPTPPPEPFYAVTGNGNPSPNGDYLWLGGYAFGRKEYIGPNGYKIQCQVNQWILGQLNIHEWLLGGVDAQTNPLTGSYVPIMSATGFPVVAVGV